MIIPTISTEELRQLLDRGAAVTVLDVRPAAERAEWAIPGSVHADAYEALRRGDPNALADFRPRDGGPVVTVCGAGKTSLLAAERLRARGLDAVSLEGGMRAWTLAWNAAAVPRPGSTAQIVQVRRTGKGCLSYIIGSHGQAAVIDASLDPGVYREPAAKAGRSVRSSRPTCMPTTYPAPGRWPVTPGRHCTCRRRIGCPLRTRRCAMATSCAWDPPPSR